MTEQLEVVRDVVTRLEKAGIPYMITGSFAMSAYATPRMTRDVDLVIDVSADDSARLVELFADGYYAEERSIREAVRRRDMFNIIHAVTVTKIDLVIRKETEYRRLEMARRRRKVVADLEAWFVAPEDLILSKLHWARESRSETQLEDVRNLIAAVASLDREYMSRWASELGVSEMLAEVDP